MMVDLSRLAFRIATTMPEIPHEYVVRTAENEDAYRELFDIIGREGVDGRFRGRVYRYWRHGGHRYWAMTDDLAQSQVINRAKLDDDKDARELNLFWAGPHAWPGFEATTSLPPLPNHSGVYLWTFEHRSGGYLIHVVGLSKHVLKRHKDHVREYMKGAYTVLDPTQAREGVRSEVWHGWGYWRAHSDEFAARRTEIQAAVKQELDASRIFVAEVSDRRQQHRLEAAIMKRLYADGAPLPDAGMQLSPRWENEPAIVVSNACASVLHGLPTELLI